MRLLEVTAPDERQLNNEFTDANSPVEINSILRKYRARKFSFPGSAQPPIYVIGDYVIEMDGSYANAEHIYRWLYDIDVFDYYPNEEAEWNQEFWARSPPLYHATPRENLADILRDGLIQQDRTRGISNRHVGMAVFTTTSQDSAHSGSYGDTVIVIDTKRLAASGDPPFAAREPDVVREELRGSLAHRLEREDFEPEVESGMDPSTVVLYGDIPAAYLAVDTYTPRIY